MLSGLEGDKSRSGFDKNSVLARDLAFLYFFRHLIKLQKNHIFNYISDSVARRRILKEYILYHFMAGESQTIEQGNSLSLFYEVSATMCVFMVYPTSVTPQQRRCFAINGEKINTKPYETLVCKEGTPSLHSVGIHTGWIWKCVLYHPIFICHNVTGHHYYIMK